MESSKKELVKKRGKTKGLKFSCDTQNFIDFIANFLGFVLKIRLRMTVKRSLLAPAPLGGV